MILIWGFKSYVTVMAMANIVCGNCHNPAANRLHRITRKFTLFFIPLFPVSKKYVLQCTFCGVQSKLTKEQAEAFASHANGQVQPGAPQAAPQQMPQQAPQMPQAPAPMPQAVQPPPPPPYQG